MQHLNIGKWWPEFLTEVTMVTMEWPSQIKGHRTICQRSKAERMGRGLPGGAFSELHTLVHTHSTNSPVHTHTHTHTLFVPTVRQLEILMPGTTRLVLADLGFWIDSLPVAPVLAARSLCLRVRLLFPGAEAVAAAFKPSAFVGWKYVVCVCVCLCVYVYLCVREFQSAVNNLLHLRP